MAGPGGGPPRKSHTKSRNGCKTCKRRHIRCDETFPQCRNCTKHNCRCDYMDVTATAAANDPRNQRAPDLLMSQEIEMEIENWRMTGTPPFPELSMCPRSGWHGFSRSELRLIHHITGQSIDLHRRGYSNSTIWAQRMPNFLAIALSNDFVMSSILALSAFHLAWITQNKETENLAYYHRGIAIKGLQDAISSFSRENCDAILAASMLLSWQATEWRGWLSLQQGVSTVLNAMQPEWKYGSELARFLEGQKAFRTENVPLISGYPGCGNQYQDEDLVRFDRTCATLQNMQQRISHNREYCDRITDLLGFVQRLRKDLPIQSPEEAFERLQPLRRWVFWLPSAMLRGGDTDLGALAVLAQYFGIALALEPLLPNLGGPYLGSISAGPIEDIQRILLERKAAEPFSPQVQLAVALLDLPCDIVAEYRSRLQWSSYSYSPVHSPYHGVQDFQVASSSSTTSAYMAYTSPIHSPPALAVPGSPYHLTSSYGQRQASNNFYTASPSIQSEPTDDRTSLSDYSRSGTLDHSPAFSPAYVDDMIGGVTGAESAAGLNMGLCHETPTFHAGGFVAPELCWTGSFG